MLRKRLKYAVLWLFLVLVSLSCTKEIDFEQANDLQIAPVFESSLVYINQPATRFFVENAENVAIKDSTTIDFLDNGFIYDNLIKAVFTLETTNSINRGFMVEVNMLDDGDVLLHSFSFSSGASTSNQEVVTEHVETFEGASLDALKRTTKFVFTLYLLPGTPLNENTPGRIILKSKAAFYLNVEP